MSEIKSKTNQLETLVLLKIQFLKIIVFSKIPFSFNLTITFQIKTTYWVITKNKNFSIIHDYKMKHMA